MTLSYHRQPVLLLCPSLVGAGVERRIYVLINQLGKHWDQLRLGLLREEGQFLSRVRPSLRLYIAPGKLCRLICLPVRQCRELYHSLLAIDQIKAMLKTFRPVVVVTFTLETTLPMYFVKLLAPRQSTIWIISEDSNTAIAASNACRFAFINKILQKMLGCIYRKADYITTVSSTVLQSLTQIYQISPQRCNVIHNPIDIESIQKLGNKSRPFQFDYIIAVGRLVKVKQFDLLIRAFAHLHDSDSMHLVILGEGPEKLNLQQLANDLKVTDRIHFPGFVDNPWVYMKHARMLVLTSMTEGFGNVLVEAMAVGCPVIATDCGGPTDIIKHNINGLITTQDETSLSHVIKRLLLNPDFANTLSRQAKVDIKQFSPQHSCARFNQMLIQLLTSRQNPFSRPDHLTTS